MLLGMSSEPFFLYICFGGGVKGTHTRKTKSNLGGVFGVVAFFWGGIAW